MELFFSTTQTPAVLISALDMLQIPYSSHAVEEDPAAQERLFNLSGALNVPTLVFDDGTYLVEPTPAQFAEKMLSLQPALPKAPAASPLFQMSVWVRICAVVCFGLGACGLGFGLSNAHPFPGVYSAVLPISALLTRTS